VEQCPSAVNKVKLAFPQQSHRIAIKCSSRIRSFYAERGESIKTQGLYSRSPDNRVMCSMRDASAVYGQKATMQLPVQAMFNDYVTSLPV
jgi:hypothetical protein